MIPEKEIHYLYRLCVIEQLCRIFLLGSPFFADKFYLTIIPRVPPRIGLA